MTLIPILNKGGGMKCPPGMADPIVAKGRNALDWKSKFELDIQNVDNWSLKLDGILSLKSLFQALRREGISAVGHVTMPAFTGHAKPNKR